jgi:hypothetical protein
MTSICDFITKNLQDRSMFNGFNLQPESFDIANNILGDGGFGIVGRVVLTNDRGVELPIIFKIPHDLAVWEGKHEENIFTGMGVFLGWCPNFSFGYGGISTVINTFHRYQEDTDIVDIENPFETSTGFFADTNLLEQINGKNMFSFLRDLGKNGKIPSELLSSLLLQTLCVLKIAQNKIKFTHSDLHLGNIMLVDTSNQFVCYRLADDKGKWYNYVIPTHGKIPVIIDYGTAYSTAMEGKPWFSLPYNESMESGGHTPVGFSPMKDCIFLGTIIYRDIIKEFNIVSRKNPDLTATLKNFCKTMKTIYKDNELSYNNLEESLSFWGVFFPAAKDAGLLTNEYNLVSHGGNRDMQYLKQYFKSLAPLVQFPPRNYREEFPVKSAQILIRFINICDNLSTPASFDMLTKVYFRKYIMKETIAGFMTENWREHLEMVIKLAGLNPIAFQAWFSAVNQAKPHIEKIGRWVEGQLVSRREIYLNQQQEIMNQLPEEWSGMNQIISELSNYNNVQTSGEMVMIDSEKQNTVQFTYSKQQFKSVRKHLIKKKKSADFGSIIYKMYRSLEDNNTCGVDNIRQLQESVANDNPDCRERTGVVVCDNVTNPIVPLPSETPSSNTGSRCVIM